MYKKKPTKSFFDAENKNDAKHTRKQFSSKGKENIPQADKDTRAGARDISEGTMSKLKSFALPAGPKPGVTRTDQKSATGGVPLPSSQIEDPQETKSSQVEDRVRWKISPPPGNRRGGSAQKLTINEMFDIFQASQHSSETPVRRLDPAGDLWSRYDSAEPLPYLDLELSPAHDRVPKQDAKLRRTTSLPSWSTDRKTRKRRKTELGSTSTKPGRVQGMMEQIQIALHVAGRDQQDTRSLSRADGADKRELADDARAIISIDDPTSDDFGGDELDEALLLALPGMQTPVPKRAASNPLPQSKMTLYPPPVPAHELGKMLPTVIADDRPRAPTPSIDMRLIEACAPQGYDAGRVLPRSTSASSNYSLDLGEDDFLAASQLHLPNAQVSAGQVVPPRSLTKVELEAKLEKHLTPAELLEGLDEDAFSDFEEPITYINDAHFTVTAIQYNRSPEVTSPHVLVTVKERAGKTRYARLHDDWLELDLQVQDDVRFIGAWTSETLFVATNQAGLVILYPDVLVSCTSVSDSHTCMRKSVLQDRVRATSSLSKPLLYGSMLHAILQSCLLQDNFEDAGVRKAIDTELAGNLEKLYLVDETLETAKDYLYAKALLLQQWAQKFSGSDKTARVEPMRGRSRMQQAEIGVNRALDVEERFWSPRYGLKGNVDVTAQISVSIDDRRTVVTAPLEFKTGRTEYQQSSYRAQVMLYTLMISERYQVDVSAGFLYYLESVQITRVPSLHNEVRGLIIMRNELARHMKLKSLPPMIADKRLCGSCYASDACFTYQKSSAASEDSRVTALLGDLYSGRTAHLGERDISFFNKWESLITKEEGDMFKFRHELWHMTSVEREKVGRCFGDLVVVHGSEVHDAVHGKMNQWTYKLESFLPGRNFTEAHFAEREPIIVSDESGQYALSCGFVTDIGTRTITINVDRPLRDSRTKLEGFDEQTKQLFRGAQAAAKTRNLTRYRLDKDEFKSGMGLVRNNLIALFMDPGSKNSSPTIERLRNLIVDLIEPKFAETACNVFQNSTQGNLNVDQIRAKDKIMSAKDYALILGMPGTGKTTTIAHIIKALVEAGKSVLLTSYTHSAVDTILLKVADQKMKILRLGGYAKIHPEVAKASLTERHDCKTTDELHEYYYSPSVVATTCLSINHAIFQKRRFDYCIFDEASQATLPVCIGPLRFADKFILVGDHYQLPPLVKDREAQMGGLDVSLFKILCEAHPSAVVELKHQYRMNADIMSISNELIYANRLTCGTKELENRKLQNIDLTRLSTVHRFHQAPSTQCTRATCWLDHVIDPERRVLYLNTDFIAESKEKKTHDQIVNVAESKLVAVVVEGLILCGMRDLDIGVISPYRSQLKVIQQDLQRHPQVIVDTADKFQGRDRECIIVSLVRRNDNKMIGDLLKDWRRINVAFTRAKSKMIIIGSQNTLAHDYLLNSFLHFVHKRGWAYDLPANALTLHNIPTIASQSTQEIPVRNARQDRADGGENSPLKGKRPTKIHMAGASVIQNKRPILRDLMNGL